MNTFVAERVLDEIFVDENFDRKSFNSPEVKVTSAPVVLFPLDKLLVLGIVQTIFDFALA